MVSVCRFDVPHRATDSASQTRLRVLRSVTVCAESSRAAEGSRQRFQTETHWCMGSQHKIPLHVHALQIGHGIAGAEAHEAHGLLAVQALHTGLQIDGQVLRRVAVIHIAWNVKFYAAHLVDEIDEDIQIDEHITVRPEAEPAP